VTWHYEAERLDGEGGATLLASDLPLTNVSITQTLSGTDSMTATIDPSFQRLLDDQNQPVLAGDWSTALYAVEDNAVLTGCILDTPVYTGKTLQLDGGGFGGYPYGMPYTGSEFWVGIDPIDAFREAWAHLQTQPGGNLGVILDSTTMSGKKIGTELKQGEFDTINGPLTFESGPFRYAWYQTADIGAELDKLVQETPFDWRERHQYATDGESINHYIDFGAPSIGRRLDNLRFVIGENVIAKPSVTDHGEDFANEILMLGAGEGAAMIRGGAFGPRRGVRRVKVIADKALKSIESANAQGRVALAKAQNIRDLSDIVLLDHPHAPTGAVQVGDEIYIEGRMDWIEVGMWVRVQQRTIRPADPSRVSLSVTRTDRT
jgi:hypothetical protein